MMATTGAACTAYYTVQTIISMHRDLRPLNKTLERKPTIRQFHVSGVPGIFMG